MPTETNVILMAALGAWAGTCIFLLVMLGVVARTMAKLKVYDSKLNSSQDLLHTYQKILANYENMLMRYQGRLDRLDRRASYTNIKAVPTPLRPKNEDSSNSTD